MDPLLLNIPEEFETARLTVRAPRAGDGCEAHAAIVESAERAGYCLEGVLHNYERAGDETLGDLRVYAKVRSDEEARDRGDNAVPSLV